MPLPVETIIMLMLSWMDPLQTPARSGLTLLNERHRLTAILICCQYLMT